MQTGRLPRISSWFWVIFLLYVWGVSIIQLRRGSPSVSPPALIVNFVGGTLFAGGHLAPRAIPGMSWVQNAGLLLIMLPHLMSIFDTRQRLLLSTTIAPAPEGSIIVPRLGQNPSPVKIVRWLKASGDSVKRDEAVLEVETDKCMVEIASESNGVLRVVAPAGSDVTEGEVVGAIEPTGVTP